MERKLSVGSGKLKVKVESCGLGENSLIPEAEHVRVNSINMHDTHPPSRIGIIGAGLTGMTLAHALQRRGLQVQVWESADRVGGAIRSHRDQGFLVEEGPNSMLVKSQTVADWLDSLGLSERLVAASQESKKRFIVRGGKPHAMPSHPLGAIMTPLYSTSAKLRVLKEPFIPRTTATDESVGNFVRRRLGAEFLDYGISCLVSGIYAGDPETLSVRHAFPKVWNLDQSYGSLIRGAIALKRERRKSGVPAFKSRMLSFDDGLSVLSDHLASLLGDCLHTSVELQSITRNESGAWQMHALQQGVPIHREVDQLVITIPRHQWGRLPWHAELRGTDGGSLRDALDEVEDLHYPPLSTLVLGFPREAVAHPLDGFGMLIPEQEQRFILGTIFSSTLFPGRAPEGQVSLMNFIGGTLHPERASLDTDALVQHCCRELKALLGVKSSPSFIHHCFWPRAIPQYPVGHERFLNQLEQLENQFPGLHIQGNYRGGPGLSDCMDSALRLAHALSRNA